MAPGHLAAGVRAVCQPQASHACAEGRRSALLALCSAAALSACSSLRVSDDASGGGATPERADAGGLPDEVAREVVMLALSLVDTPYRRGGNTPATGFDCSGLIVHVFRGAAGIALPRTVAQLAGFGRSVPRTEVRSADIVFFDAAGPLSHAGIYVGGGRFAHAPTSGGRVRLDSLEARYWAPRLTVVRRV